MRTLRLRAPSRSPLAHILNLLGTTARHSRRSWTRGRRRTEGRARTRARCARRVSAACVAGASRGRRGRTSVRRQSAQRRCGEVSCGHRRTHAANRALQTKGVAKSPCLPLQQNATPRCKQGNVGRGGLFATMSSVIASLPSDLNAQDRESPLQGYYGPVRVTLNCNTEGLASRYRCHRAHRAQRLLAGAGLTAAGNRRGKLNNLHGTLWYRKCRLHNAAP